MDKHKLMCNLLLEGDSYFNDENVDTPKFNKHSIIKAYCLNNDCKTNEERINALAIYIFKKFKDSIKRQSKHNDYDECFLLWLSDKLFKMDDESKDKRRKVYNITLNQAYEKHLKGHKVKLDHWVLFDNIKGLKNANLKYMSEFYKLLNNICNTIADYNDKGAKSKKLSKYSSNCSYQYKTLYMNVSECKPYLDLLNKLKGIYDDFRTYAIKNNSLINNLATKLKKLTLEDGTEMEAVRGFKSYDIRSQQCKRKKKKPASSQKAEPPSPKEPEPETQQSSSTTPSEEPPGKLELPSSSQESHKPGKNDQNELKDSGKGGGGPKIEIKGPDVESRNMNGEVKESGAPSGGEGIQISKGDGSNGESSGTNAGKGDSEGGSGSSNNEQGGKDSQPGGSSSGTENLGRESSDKDPGGNTGDKKNLQIDTSITQDNSLEKHEDLSTSGDSVDDSTKDKESTNNTMEKHQQNDSLESNPQEKPQDIQKGTSPLQEPEQQQQPPSGQPKESQDGSGDSENGPGSEQTPPDSDLGEKETQNPSWPLFDIRSYIYTITSKGMEQINNASNFIISHKTKITEGIDNIRELYNTSVSNLKNTFNNFTEFFNNFIIDLSIDSKPIEKTPNLGDDQSGSGGSEGDPPTDNDPSQRQKDSDKQDSTQQNSHQPSSDTPQTPKAPPTSPTSPTPPTPQNSKDQTQEHRLSPDTSGKQTSDRADQEGPPKPVPASVTKQKNSGTELKGNRITEIGDIYILKEYKKIVISIIVILIPITLTILYKYLSLGRRNELKKKNNMKKVINMVGVNKTTKTVINSSDGKKKIQIIIKSSSKKKKTKKYINSVYGEKSPSLNIYQLMQADPVPFINLIFLLIFFVYKRKRDFIE
ncbi:CIR protein [Plasmodium chabaudi chabaudi]|uniref:CIR protein n=1 Tax=Plasmodium chabaudi chabaudi TaxID=31271 RepID=A0A4V0KAN4_PLACU|nr:CIR protein [Plasmodium chabaudi chabaudi]VTZ69952.1 CIR protein [Plasmodium chabaudi chabaudi]